MSDLLAPQPQHIACVGCIDCGFASPVGTGITPTDADEVANRVANLVNSPEVTSKVPGDHLYIGFQISTVIIDPTHLAMLATAEMRTELEIVGEPNYLTYPPDALSQMRDQILRHHLAEVMHEEREGKFPS